MNDDSEIIVQNAWASRSTSKIIDILNYRNWTYQAETSYLAILRYAALAGATMLSIIAALLFLWGLLMQLGSTTSTPEPVAITGTDLASAIATTKVDNSTKPDVKQSEPDWRQAFPAAFQAAYFDLYRKQFGPYIRQGDAKLEKTQFLNMVFPTEFL